MPPVALPLALSAASSLIPSMYSLLQGRRQQEEAERLLSTQRPEYKIPGSVNTALTTAQNTYGDLRLPGQSNIENKIYGNSANAIRGITEGGNPNDTINAVSAINQNQNTAFNDLGAAAANHHASMLQLYLNQLGNHAGYEDKAFAYNQDAPYQAKIHTGSALLNAGNLNEFSGVRGFSDFGSKLGSTVAGAYMPGGALYTQPAEDMGTTSTSNNPNSPWLNYNTQPGTGMSSMYNPRQLGSNGFEVPMAPPQDDHNLALAYMNYYKNQQTGY